MNVHQPHIYHINDVLLKCIFCSEYTINSENIQKCSQNTRTRLPSPDLSPSVYINLTSHAYFQYEYRLTVYYKLHDFKKPITVCAVGKIVYVLLFSSLMVFSNESWNSLELVGTFIDRWTNTLSVIIVYL